MALTRSSSAPLRMGICEAGRGSWEKVSPSSCPPWRICPVERPLHGAPASRTRPTLQWTSPSWSVDSLYHLVRTEASLAVPPPQEPMQRLSHLLRLSVHPVLSQPHPAVGLHRQRQLPHVHLRLSVTTPIDSRRCEREVPANGYSRAKSHYTRGFNTTVVRAMRMITSSSSLMTSLDRIALYRYSNGATPSSCDATAAPAAQQREVRTLRQTCKRKRRVTEEGRRTTPDIDSSISRV